MQALCAMGAVVAPATLAPVLQGWLIDTHDWTWILFGVFPVALAAAGLLLLSEAPPPPAVPRRDLDLAGLAGLAIALFAAAFLLSKGNRWDRSEGHTSALQSLMRIAYAGLGLKKTDRT